MEHENKQYCNDMVQSEHGTKRHSHSSVMTLKTNVKSIIKLDGIIVKAVIIGKSNIVRRISPLSNLVPLLDALCDL